MDYRNYWDFGDTNQELAAIEQLLQQILNMKQEIKELNETIRWMHSVIWDERDKIYNLKEEIRELNQALEQGPTTLW